MTEAEKIIEAMRNVAPPYLESLNEQQVVKLRSLSNELAAASPDAAAEHLRFTGIQSRSLGTLGSQLEERLAGKVVMVTGGTGCIGSTLLRLVLAYHPAHTISISRGVTRCTSYFDGVTYVKADIRDYHVVKDIISDVHPDVIFHVAAQRSPSLGEREPYRTITTNVLGTQNVLSAAEIMNVPQVTCASTGKAMRPYSLEVYTATKRVAEWLAAATAQRGNMMVSACRFTHVVDNSIIYQLLRSWSTKRNGIIRLHSSDTLFYAQSALESAQLLLVAFLGTRRGELRVHAIRDLGWPVSLLGLALGTRQICHSDAPVYFSGFDPGYEELAYPGLYDPVTAGDTSPLLNAFEAARTTVSLCEKVDSSKVTFDYADDALERIAHLEGASGAYCRRVLRQLSQMALDAALAALPSESIERSLKLISGHTLTEAHQHIVSASRHALSERGYSVYRKQPP